MNTTGLEKVKALLLRSYTPLEAINGAEWAEKHIDIVPDSPILGKLSFEATPWMREPINEGTTSTAERVTILAPVQWGKTLIFKICAMYHLREIPSPILFLSDTPENADDFALTSLNPMLAQNNYFSQIISTNRSEETKLTHVYTNGAILWTRGASTKGNLQRRSARIVILDECWLYPPGHMAEAVARTTRFRGWSKVLEGSQAGEVDGDLDRSFRKSDRREWCWTCPACGHVNPWGLDMLTWDTDARTPDGSPDFRKIEASMRYRCPECGEAWLATAKKRAELNRRSAWVPQAPDTAEPGHVGFHTTALCFERPEVIIREYIHAKHLAKSGDFSELKIFTQKRLAEPWSIEYELRQETPPESEAVTYGTREIWSRTAYLYLNQIVPSKPDNPTQRAHPMLFMGVDVQRGGFWYVIRAFAFDGDSMLQECGSLTAWGEVLQKAAEWGVPAPHIGIDSGDQTQEVYKFCADNNFKAMKGSRITMYKWREKDKLTGRLKVLYKPYNPGVKVPVQVPTRTPSGREKIVVKRITLITFSSAKMKDGIHFARIRTKRKMKPVMECPKDTPAEYEAQVARSERRVMKAGEYTWEQIGKRDNHMLDAECIVRALALKKGLPLDAIVYNDEAEK